MLLLATSSALAATGCCPAPADLVRRRDLLDHSRKAELAVLCAAAVLCVLGVLVLANLLLLGRSSRAHLVLLELLLVGSFGAVLTSAAELREAHIEWDRAPANPLKTPAHAKSISKSRKGGRTYYLPVADWDAPGGSRRVKVPPAFTSRFSPATGS